MPTSTLAYLPVTATRPPGTRPVLITRQLLIRFVSMVGSATSFYLLLSVVPSYVAAAGGAAPGAVTGALMLATVLGEMVTPRLVARYGYRWVLATGLALLGVPSLALMASTHIAAVVAVCLVRGLGFALTVVAGGAMTATLIPAERRGEGLALTGVVAGVPALAALPLGLWLSAHHGYPPVFVAAAVAALIALATVPWLPTRTATAGKATAIGVFAGMRMPQLRRPALVFALTTTAAGVFVTFLPLAVRPGSAGVVGAALFAQSAASTAARWWAGRHGDRHGFTTLLIPGLLAAAAGMALLMFTSSTAAVLIAAVVFGTGFGIAQNATLATMYSRVPQSAYGTASALWNLAYDAGLGIGAVAFGALAVGTGYPIAFVLTALVVIVGLPIVRRDRRAG
ncbi:MFS transporter [Plantactinospora sp. S1510]|uniref:MFS transporter n=1 Tax=Plantactinospora alkalitolerans TaxID=2789879 RepID=A0ABS0H3B7_9ACTN|nr:MFS transporter [Plantactinospora alkalitolerans]MBF9132965.1 MFS transporter [Plantactinospora alkalitolerans]